MVDQSYSNFDLKKVWQEMAKKKFLNKEIEKQEIMEALRSNSQSTIVNLKAGLRTKLNWIIGFMLFFGATAGLDWLKPGSDPEHLFYFGFAGLYLAGFLITYRKYQKIDVDPIDENSILSKLKMNRQAIKSVLNIERIWGMIAMLFVFIYKVNDWANKTHDDPKHLAITVSIFLLFIVILGFIAELANRRRFGKQLKKLDENIIRLETLS